MNEADGRPTAVLRSEHAVLRHEAAHLARVAGALSEWSASDIPERLAEIHGFLYGRLLPHAEAEDAVLYPMMDKVLGAHQATATMTADHDAIHERTDALAAVISTIGGVHPHCRRPRRCGSISTGCGRSSICISTRRNGSSSRCWTSGSHRRMPAP